MKCDELEAENTELKAKLETVNELVKTSKDLYDHTIESLKASHYADSVDAGMRERRLRRALWLARELRARDIQRWWLSATCAPVTERAYRIWNNVERKCISVISVDGTGVGWNLPRNSNLTRRQNDDL